MRILVTGGAGFIGSHVADRYIELGHEVAVLDDLSSGKPENVNPRAKLFRMSLLDERLAGAFDEFRPEVVSHHAAQVNVRRSVDAPEFDATVNVVGSVRLFQAAAAHGCGKVIYASSGGACYGDPPKLPAREDTPVRPLCPYGVSKYAAEKYLQLFGAAQRDALHRAALRERLRPAAGFARRGRRRGDLQRAAARGQDADDLRRRHEDARLRLRLRHRPGERPGARRGRRRRLQRRHRARGERRPGFRGRARRRRGEDRSGRTPSSARAKCSASRSTPSRIRDELGWRPRVAIEQGIPKAVEFYRAKRGSRPSAGS